MKFLDKWIGRGRTQPYTIVAKAGDAVEVNLNGEIVQSVPYDFWTGEKASGLFIVLQNFLEDVEKLQGAGEVTFRINSVGGDVEAGIQIYNRIRALPGKTVTVVEGLAASAASIVAQAGDVRRMAEGSQIMLHGVSGFLYGYYNRESLQKQVNALEKLDESLAEIYAGRSGMDRQAALRMMRKETWMTARDALEANLADEVDSGVFPAIGSVPGMPGCVMVGGVRHPLMGLPMPMETFPFPHGPKGTVATSGDSGDVGAVVGGGAAPTSGSHFGESNEVACAGLESGDVPVSLGNGDVGGAVAGSGGGNDGNATVVSIQANQGGGKRMVLEELKANYPELAEQIREEERGRLRKIDEIAPSVKNAALVERAKYEEPVSAEELALAALKAQQAAGERFLADLGDDLPKAASLPQAPNGGMETQALQEEEALNVLLDKISQKGGN